MVDVFIHKTAEVSAKATIGFGTKIWNNAQIREDASIGANCIIGKDVYIDRGVRIGNNVKIQNGVSVYSGVEVGNNVFIGPNVTFTNDMYPRSFNTKWQITPTIVNEGSSLGANSTIVCGVQIGKFSMIGAGSVVTKNVSDYHLVVGTPARFMGFVCSCGHPLNNSDQCTLCGHRYYIFNDRIEKKQAEKENEY